MIHSKVFTRIVLAVALLLVAGFPVRAQTNLPSPKVNSASDFSFIIAGHAYGAHEGNNLGLYPKFLRNLQADFPAEFLILAGDTVRLPATQAQWQTLAKELQSLRVPYYLVMGNNDNSVAAQAFFKREYGSTSYFFDVGNARFVILNSQKQPGSISAAQLTFLDQLLESHAGTTLFVFFHELLWNSNPDYKGIKANQRSRYGHEALKQSNYWSEVHPLLKQYPDKQIFVVAGDVAGRPDSIPAFYQKLDNVTLLATGMGEIVDENYLLVKLKNDQAEFTLVPLNQDNTLKALGAYTSENLKPNGFKGFAEQLAVWLQGLLDLIYPERFWTLVGLK